MAEYEITVTKRVINPAFVEYRPPMDGYHYDREDRRTPEQQRQFDEYRVIAVTLTEAEYDAVRQALIAHWAKA